MRIKKEIENISYNDTQSFFDTRARKYNKDNPYAVTMYQDEHPELVKERNDAEIRKIKPLLRLDKNSRVLDVACGIGRWSDAITEEIEEYCGIDFCSEFIELAKKRNKKENHHFYNAGSVDIKKCMDFQKKGKFNRVLVVGALMYLNDADVEKTIEQIEDICDSDAIICIREPIGIGERLTLKEQFSEELKDTYNAIYRTKEELERIFEKKLLNKNFTIRRDECLFSGNVLNNRKETIQYYWIIER